MKRIVLAVIAVVILCAGGYCGWRYYHDVYLPNKQITDAEQEQRLVFEQLKPDPVATEAFTDGGEEPPQKLTELNGGAVGWITIDGTVIDYPIVQSDDNSYYLDHGVDGEYNNGLGCPFLDYRCKSDFSGFSSIVYAHHIQNYRALFSDITLYSDPDFMSSHPEGTLLTKNGAHRVRFFAYLTLPNPSFAYNTDLNSKEARGGYIDDIFQNAEYTTAFSPEELKKNQELRLLLLSTCSYDFWNARGVLAGVIE